MVTNYYSFSKLQFTVMTIEKLKYTNTKSQKQRKYNAIIFYQQMSEPGNECTER